MSKSGRQDLNLRPFAPKANALPACATPRVLFLSNRYFNTSKELQDKSFVISMQ